MKVILVSVYMAFLQLFVWVVDWLCLHLLFLPVTWICSRWVLKFNIVFTNLWHQKFLCSSSRRIKNCLQIFLCILRMNLQKSLLSSLSLVPCTVLRRMLPHFRLPRGKHMLSLLAYSLKDLMIFFLFLNVEITCYLDGYYGMEIPS